MRRARLIFLIVVACLAGTASPARALSPPPSIFDFEDNAAFSMLNPRCEIFSDVRTSAHSGSRVVVVQYDPDTCASGTLLRLPQPEVFVGFFLWLPPGPTVSTSASTTMTISGYRGQTQITQARVNVPPGAWTPVTLSAPSGIDRVDYAPRTSLLWVDDLAISPAPQPDTEITSGPPSLTNSSLAQFGVASSEPGARILCSLDGVRVPTCGPFQSLAEATHTLTARAVDSYGATDATPAQWTWRVDVTAPDTGISQGPASVSAESSATFTFGSPDSDVAGFQCRLDGGAFATCSSPQPLRGLAAGMHTFEVRAIDGAGNVDPTPAARSWRVARDADGDGFSPEFGRRDCDDRRADVHPGAREIPGDRVDENCDGRLGRFGRIGSTIRISVRVLGARTVVRQIRVLGAVRGARVGFRCVGGGCNRRDVRRGTVVLQRAAESRRRGRRERGFVLPLLRRPLRLRPGAALEFRITKRCMIGARVRFRIRDDAEPSRDRRTLRAPSRAEARRC